MCFREVLRNILCKPPKRCTIYIYKGRKRDFRDVLRNVFPSDQKTYWTKKVYWLYGWLLISFTLIIHSPNFWRHSNISIRTPNWQLWNYLWVLSNVGPPTYKIVIFFYYFVHLSNKLTNEHLFVEWLQHFKSFPTLHRSSQLG